MGYTHHWRGTPGATIDDEAWELLKDDITTICGFVPTPIQLDVADGLIHLNGIGNDSHETFVLKQELTQAFDFCKTARKPYDLVVCASLLRLLVRAPGHLEVSSDGTRLEWDDAITLVQHLFSPTVAYEVPVDGIIRIAAVGSEENE